MMKNNNVVMTSGNIFKNMIIYSIAVMLNGILQLLYNAADLVVVSNFSTEANAIGAVGSCSSIVHLLTNISLGLAVGTNVLSARFYPHNDRDNLKKVFDQSIILGIIFGLFFGAIGFIFADQFLTLMNNPIQLSRVYFRIICLGMPFNLIFNFLGNILQGAGDTKKPLIILTISGLTNVILNLFFCIVFNLGVRGVAIATITSQALSAILFIIEFSKRKDILNFHLKDLKFDWKTSKEVISIGLPAGIETSTFSISNVYLQSSLNKFGSQAIDGISASGSLGGFVYIAMHCVYTAAISFIQQNFSTKNYHNIKIVIRDSILLVTIIGVIFGGLFTLFQDPLISIYTKDPISIEVAKINVYTVITPYFIFGIGDVMCGILRGLNRNKTSMIEAILTICVFRVLYILFIFNPIADFNNYKDVLILYYSYPLSWLLELIVYSITIAIAYKKDVKPYLNLQYNIE